MYSPLRSEFPLDGVERSGLKETPAKGFRELGFRGAARPLKPGCNIPQGRLVRGQEQLGSQLQKEESHEWPSEQVPVRGRRRTTFPKMKEYVHVNRSRSKAVRVSDPSQADLQRSQEGPQLRKIQRSIDLQDPVQVVGVSADTLGRRSEGGGAEESRNPPQGDRWVSGKKLQQAQNVVLRVQVRTDSQIGPESTHVVARSGRRHSWRT